MSNAPLAPLSDLPTFLTISDLEFSFVRRMDMFQTLLNQSRANTDALRDVSRALNSAGNDSADYSAKRHAFPGSILAEAPPPPPKRSCFGFLRGVEPGNADNGSGVTFSF